MSASLPDDTAVPAAAEAVSAGSEQSSAEKQHPFYQDGDWYRYVTSQEYVLSGPRSRKLSDDFIVDSESSVGFSGIYGKSWFTDKKYKLYDEDTPVSRVIDSGFTPSNEIRLMLQGHAGKRLTVYIDHNSDRDVDETNTYIMQYRAADENEVLRELNAGDISVKI
ncbi:MAG: hypothetical protein ACRCUT_07540, partial [Spirochaetota bacterium]